MPGIPMHTSTGILSLSLSGRSIPGYPPGNFLFTGTWVAFNLYQIFAQIIALSPTIYYYYKYLSLEIRNSPRLKRPRSQVMFIVINKDNELDKLLLRLWLLIKTPTTIITITNTITQVLFPSHILACNNCHLSWYYPDPRAYCSKNI